MRQPIRRLFPDPLRIESSLSTFEEETACGHCASTGCPWDRIGEGVRCFECQEDIILGRAESWQLPLEPRRCLLCPRLGVIRYLTFPICEPEPVEMDLCSGHLRALLGRRLRPKTWRRLRRRLNRVGFAVEQFFLLHEAFYDEDGNAFQPLF